MPGQIPKYGAYFRLESLPYGPELANRAYMLKRDPYWFIQSNKASKIWRIYHYDGGLCAPRSVGTPLPTLGQAMSRLLVGIDQGFYATAWTAANHPGLLAVIPGGRGSSATRCAGSLSECEHSRPRPGTTGSRYAGDQHVSATDPATWAPWR
jgi:hypothetical protein